MGVGQSSDSSSTSESAVTAEEGGTQLYVLLKMHKINGSQLPQGLLPHVYGSAPMVGCWDPSKAIAMERESVSMWELSFVVPLDHGAEALEFKFLLKAKENLDLCIIEEGPNRILYEGNMEGDAGSLATFKILGADNGVFKFPVSVSADQLSPFTLAASWRSYKENLQSHGSMVRGIPDISIATTPSTLSSDVQPSGSQELELDLEHYEIPAPASGVTAEAHYAADATENPRGLQRSPSLPVPLTSHSSILMRRRESALSRDRCVSIKDLVVLGSQSPVKRTVTSMTPEAAAAGPASTTGESRSIGTDPLSVRFEDHEGHYVNRGVGSSPKFLRLGSDVSVLNSDLQLDDKAEDMPEAAGAVAAAAVADRLLGPKERRQLAIVLVGLPARGKTFTAAKLTRYLRWLGHDTKHFNVGKYRRLKIGCSQTADFFRADNQEGVDARNEVAMLAMEDMLAWMEEGGQVGVFDATNSTSSRRNMILKMAEGKCKEAIVKGTAWSMEIEPSKARATRGCQ
ncbi:hypothetical protein O6H91_14G052100 [Diphasiastrum complanatum]|uniref:Uncharacterized protein n=1 Tax=Diphasiastrum complanatum TaxID=34168 RepID=A0ACC2BPQ1_DIPCM|nr:hypothetical protein O6H91_14G052100 [Diphasiastrum complanatum]